MLDVWLYSIISVVLVSLLSLVGVFTLSLKDKHLKNSLLFLVSFSAGALFGDAFIHLIPEAFEFNLGVKLPIYILSGILIFFVLEKFIHWRHCHVVTSHDHPHPFAIMNLVGDGLHNFMDGLIIGGSYLINIPLGITTTIAVILHEIPQEIGDFGVLLHSGLSKSKALFYNFLSGFVAVFGAVLAITIGSRLGEFSSFLIPFTAGGFIYIAGSDLIPELHKEVKASRSFFQFVAFILGILIMLALILLE
ncbi:MAG: ZIP family metal transporter [Candidatus Nanoarchaeia archaeon]|jgi:zinc and cadmium transporter|nr:ZIP family metal transporter [Candidatus Nanoarchaeia archaeon]|tara:strand:- start:6606 stop:7352 length:747 start_codon:yes stop_codon:yes gene_type:complete